MAQANGTQGTWTMRSTRISASLSRNAFVPIRSSKRVAKTNRSEDGTWNVRCSALSRRETSTYLSAAALILCVEPAKAGLFGPPKEEVYRAETQAVLDSVKETLALEKGDPTREDKIVALRKETAQWVAKYRRDPTVAGKQSYSNMYTALNAIAGHYNNFGTKAPIPKKRLERVLVEINTAENALASGR